MTDQQIKYWQLVEQERANKAQEALKAKEVATKQQEADTKEATRKQDKWLSATKQLTSLAGTAASLIPLFL